MQSVMNIAQILQNLFEVYPSPTCQRNFNDLTYEEHIQEFSAWLKSKLNGIDQQYGMTKVVPEGRLGPAKVVFVADQNDGNNLVKISKDKLTIVSQSAFCTLKANCCVYKGKWMYEVQLRSKGVMQIGWCSSRCVFTQDTGVGDTKNSYGFDGSKQRVWHVHTRKYGPYWRSGDVFGICLDMDDGKIEYYRNGVSLGIAFDNVSRGPGIALFPAASLAFDDSLTANFGGSPFRHPVDGYKALQMCPVIKLEKAEFLLNNLVNIARIISTNRPQKLRSNKDVSADTTYALLASLLINEIASILCNNYVIEEKVFRHVKGMCVIRTNIDSNSIIYPGYQESTLGTFLSLFWTYLQGDLMKCFLSKFAAFLSSMYRETPVDLNYEKQRIVIVVLTCICNHPATRKYLLEYKFFNKNLLPIFLYIKPPDESTLADLIPDRNVWTNGMETSKEAYLNDCQKLNSSTDALYTLQKNLMDKLLINTDGSDTSASSRKIFITKMRKYVIENSVEHRTIYFLEGISYAPPTQPAVALSFLCISLDVLQTLYANELPDSAAFVPPHSFYDGSQKYFHFDRVGGVLSHLQRHYREELIARLGSDHSSFENSDDQLVSGIYNGVELSDIYSAMFLLTGNSTRSQLATLRSDARPTDMHGGLSDGANVSNGSSSNFSKISDPPVKPGEVTAQDSLKSLLDCCILYYYAVAHKYIIMIADLRDSIGTLSEILCETKLTYEVLLKTMETVSSDSMISSMHGDVLKDLHDKLMERRQVFLKRSTELARKQAWYRSVALGKFRRNLLCWMLNAVVRTLKEASEEGDLFAFVPEFYINILPILLDTIMDFSFHDLNIQNDLSDCSHIIGSAADFLCSKAANSRVILASCKDALLQALGTLTCHEAGIRALENCSLTNQKTLIASLLRPYQGRAWGQSNWLLLRFWLGDGFGYRDARQPSIWQDGTRTPSLGLFRSRGKNGSHTGLLHHIAPSNPSPYFQRLIAETLIVDEPFSSTLINSILSQLNWAFSEFVLLLQEIQNGMQRQDHTHSAYESRQLKICSMCFELTVSLMRTLEMMISIAPSVFIDTTRPNSATLLNRVCQLISQVLSRVTIPPGCFQYVIDMCMPELSSVTHFAIISAAIGILLALLKDEIHDEEGFINMPVVAKILLTDPSFQIACLEYTVGDVKTPIQIQQEIPRGNFDAQSRRHIDPLTNEVRFSAARPRCEQPVIKFSLLDYPTHVTADEIECVKKLIKYLLIRKSLLSDVTLPSDDTICTICYATSIEATFSPCNHQSCASCITQHLMNTKVCFYCKTLIARVQNFDGTIIYEHSPASSQS